MAVSIPIYLYKDEPTANWEGANSKIHDSEYIRIIQGEANSLNLTFHLFSSRSEPLDLTDKTVTFYFTKPDGEQILLSAEISATAAANGEATVTLTAQSTAASGLTKYGEIRVTGGDADVQKFEVPVFYIAPSHTENAIESTSEFHALDSALSKVQPYLTSMESALSAMQTTLAEITSSAKAARESAELSQQKAQDAANAKDGAYQCQTDAKSSADLAHQDALGASSSATTASSAALTEIGKQKGQTNGLASLGSDGKLNQRLEYSHLDTLPSAFPAQSHTHPYSDLTGTAPFLPNKRTRVESLQAAISEGGYIIWGTDTSSTPTNTNCWIIDVKQEGWGMVAVAYGLYDLSIYMANRTTNDNGNTFLWGSWKKVF